MNKMSYLEETLRRLGASDAQLRSATAKLFERAMMEDSEFCQKVTADALERIAATFEDAKTSEESIRAIYADAMANAKLQAQALTTQINAMAKVFRQEADRCEKLKNESKDVIYDAELNEAVKAYRAVLAATKEIFGEYIQGELNQAAMVAAINAGSYVAWRGIMGPAAKPQEGMQIQNVTCRKKY